MPPELNDGQGSPLDPNDDARLPDGTTPPPALADGGGQPEAAPIDSDDAELAAARAALAAEEAAAAAGLAPASQQPPPAGNAQDTPPAAAGPEGGAKPAPMVPHSVFHKERSGRQAAEREADFLRGQVEALKSVAQGAPPTTAPATGTPAAAPSPAATAQTEIQAKEAEIFAAADRFDTGEITMAEFKRIEAAASARITDLRTQQAIAASMPQQGPSLADTAIITAHLTTLAEAHPYSELLSEAQAQWLARRLLDEAAALGQSYGTGPQADMALQAAVAKASDEWGPKFGLTLPPEVVAKRAAAGGTQQHKPGQPGGLSPDAQARLRKMDLAGGLPPDTAAMGSGSTGLDLSEAAITAMDEDAIAALPAATRQRILNMTG